MFNAQLYVVSLLSWWYAAELDNARLSELLRPMEADEARMLNELSTLAAIRDRLLEERRNFLPVAGYSLAYQDQVRLSGVT